MKESRKRKKGRKKGEENSSSSSPSLLSFSSSLSSSPSCSSSPSPPPSSSSPSSPSPSPHPSSSSSSSSTCALFGGQNKFLMSHAVADFGDIDSYFGGLELLIGPVPHPDIEHALFVEHCQQPDTGFGGSLTQFTASNYGIVTTPKEEYEFVVNGDEKMIKEGGIDASGNCVPPREGIKIHCLVQNAVERMTDVGMKVAPEDWEAIKLTPAEIIALRLYTGPCYILYNKVLRAKGEGSCAGKFTTTIHLINSGILKLARLQELKIVYRGIGGRILPDIFRFPSKFGGKGGVEYGFMSCSLERHIALGYASGDGGNMRGTLLELRMGLFHKGCQLDWLSQYPHEKEILFAPLTGIEVASEMRVSDHVEIWPVQLCVNLRSVEIEKLVMWRKTQHLEMLNIFYREICNDCESLEGFKAGFRRHIRSMSLKDGEWFNKDTNFSEATLQGIEMKQFTMSLASHLKKSFRSSREIPNLFQGEESLIPHEQLLKILSEQVNQLLEINPPSKNYMTIASHPSRHSTRDHTVYTGPAGIAYTLLRVASVEALPKEERARIFQKAEEYLACSLQCLDKNPEKELISHDVGFLVGPVGVYALACVMAHLRGDSKTRNKHLDLVLLQRFGCEVDELLYGRSGYLWSLLFVWQELSDDVSKKKDIERVIEEVFVELIKKGSGKKGKPLTWTFNHGVSGSSNNYLGAAHGDAGILLPLLQARRALQPQVWKRYERLLIRSVDYLKSRQLDDGNFPCSVKDEFDHLVHWCHGAPGGTALFLLAYKMFGVASYATTARKCAEVCWHRGLLKKGVGLCHGMSGNAYSFLQVAKLDLDQRDEIVRSDCYFRASCFARAIFQFPEQGNESQKMLISSIQSEMEGYQDYQRLRRGCPDHPFSLMEGTTGSLFFLSDLIEPERASFPAYEIEVRFGGLAEVLQKPPSKKKRIPWSSSSDSFLSHKS